MLFVFIGSSTECFPETPSAGSDIKQGACLGRDALAMKGHSIPALILGPKLRLARVRFLHALPGFFSDAVWQLPGIWEALRGPIA